MATFIEVRFWIIAILMLGSVVLLFTYPKMKGKVLLLLFTFLSLVPTVGFYILNYLLRSKVLDRQSSQPLSIALSASGIVAAACLLGYVIAIREDNLATSMQPNSSQPYTAQATAQTSTPLFLYIPVSRLIILSILSGGIYYAYWIYKNWWYVRQRDVINIRPFWRGFFGIFFCHSLFKRIHSDAEARAVQVPSFSPGGLATGFIIMAILANVIGRVPNAIAIISFVLPAFLFLVPVQDYINTVTHKRNPDQQYYGWSSGHIVCLILGLGLWALTLTVGNQ